MGELEMNYLLIYFMLFFSSSIFAVHFVSAKPLQLPILGAQGETVLGIGPADQIAVSPDGKTIATSNTLGVFIWDVEEDSFPKEWIPADQLSTHQSNLFPRNYLSFANDGRLIIGGSSVEVWNINPLNRIQSLPISSGNMKMTSSEDGNYIAIVNYKPLDGNNDVLQVWDTTTGNVISQYMIPDVFPEFGSISISPDNRTVATGFSNGVILLWNANDLTPIRELKGTNRPINATDFSPDGTLLTAGAEDGSLFLWSVDSGNMIYENNTHQGIYSNIEFSNDAQYIMAQHHYYTHQEGTQSIITLQEGEATSIHNALNGQELNRLQEPSSYLPLHFSPFENEIIGFDNTGTMLSWNAETGISTKMISIHHSTHSHVGDISPDNKFLAISNGINSVHTFDLLTGRLEQRFQLDNTISAIQYTPDGNQIVIADRSGVIKIWNTDTGIAEQTIEGANNRVYDIAISPDSSKFAVKKDDHFFNVYTLHDGIIAGEFGDSSFDFDSQADLNYSNNNTEIMVISNGKLIVWDTTTFDKKAEWVLSEREDWDTSRLTRFGFMPSGEEIFFIHNNSDSFDLQPPYTIEFLNRISNETSTLVADIQRPRSSIFFHPSIPIAISTYRSGLSLWSSDTGKERKQIENVLGMYVSPNGELIVSRMQDGTARVWNVNTILQNTSTVPEFNLYQ